MLTLNSQTGTYSLLPTDYFTPSDQACRYSTGLDLGSSSPLILPTQAGSATPDLVVVTGKSSSVCDSVLNFYIVNRDNMGHMGGQVSLSNALQGGSENSPAYWAGAGTQYFYNSGIGDYVRAFTVSTAGVSVASVMNSTNTLTNGSTPAISSNGASNGILWALDRPESPDLLPGTACLLYTSPHGLIFDALGNLYGTASSGDLHDISNPL